MLLYINNNFLLLLQYEVHTAVNITSMISSAVMLYSLVDGHLNE